jgi:hypothetical protein
MCRGLTVIRRLVFGKGGMSGTFSFGGSVGAEVEGTSAFSEPLLASPQDVQAGAKNRRARRQSY